MATYSLAVTGVRAGELSVNENTTLPDAMVPSSGVTLSTATLGAQQAAMRNGTPLQCKRPDGSIGWFVLDAERSTPDVPVLRAL